MCCNRALPVAENASITHGVINPWWRVHQEESFEVWANITVWRAKNTVHGNCIVCSEHKDMCFPSWVSVLKKQWTFIFNLVYWVNFSAPNFLIFLKFSSPSKQKPSCQNNKAYQPQKKLQLHHANLAFQFPSPEKKLYSGLIYK